MLLTPPQARKLFEYCVTERFAVLAVNAGSPAAIYDWLSAARNLGAPVTIQTSLWQLDGTSFGAGDPARLLALYFAHLSLLANSEEFWATSVVLHTDHIRGPQTLGILSAAIEGYPWQTGESSARISPSSISVDASKLSGEENIALMCRLIEVSKRCGRPVTPEMKAGLDSGCGTPEEVHALVVGVESRNPGYLALLAPGPGNRRGYSRGGYPGFRPENVRHNADLIKGLTGRKAGIVLYGSSGFSDEQIREATDGLILRSSVAREYYDRHQSQLLNQGRNLG